jgi:hypothetical protein
MCFNNFTLYSVPFFPSTKPMLSQHHPGVIVWMVDICDTMFVENVSTNVCLSGCYIYAYNHSLQRPARSLGGLGCCWGLNLNV